MKKILHPTMLAIFLGLAVFQNGNAQSETKKFTAINTIFIEARLNATRDAAGFSRIFHQYESFKLSLGAGFSMWYYDGVLPTRWLPAIPLEASILWGKSKHHLEIGTGLTPYLDPRNRFNPETSEVTGTTISLAVELPIFVGYRYQKPEGGFFFRAGFIPAFYIHGGNHPLYTGWIVAPWNIMAGRPFHPNLIHPTLIRATIGKSF